MPSKATFISLSLGLAATAIAQTTTVATILLPDWCVTQSAPTVTVLGQNDLTTYSYSCSIDSAAVSSASAKASSIKESAQNKASELRASLATLIRPDDPEETEGPEDKRWLGAMKRDECYGNDAFDACIPWEVTQGASYWAVHYTVTDIVAVDQECTFGDGGVANGPATCTARGDLDPEIWGDGDGSHTETFEKTDIDEFFFRNTVSVTMGGAPAATGSGGATTGVATSGSPANNATVTGTPTGVDSPQDTGLAVQVLPAAWVVGAGGILAAAFAL